MKTLIKNCRLVSPDLDLADASILIEAGKSPEFLPLLPCPPPTEPSTPPD